MADPTRLKRIPLRDLLHHLDHLCREVSEHAQKDLIPATAELYKLTRANRKRSAYPSLRTVYNACERLIQSHQYAGKMVAAMEESLRIAEEKALDQRKA